MVSCRLVRALFCFVAADSVGLALAANPYEGIPERNAFHLMPRPPVRTQATPPALPKIHLTGITTILRGKRALLKVEFPAKPFTRPKEESYILKEGERAGPIEVLQIDEKRAQVKVDNSGVVTNLTFEKIVPASLSPMRVSRSRLRGLPITSGYH